MRLYWIETPIGRLATAPAPSGSVLDREIKDLLNEKVTNVVSLLTDEEVADLGLLAEQDALNVAGIDFSRLPIPDFGILEDYSDAKKAIDCVKSDLQHGDSAVIHCRGGIGRSSTVAGAVLTQLGINPGFLVYLQFLNSSDLLLFLYLIFLIIKLQKELTFWL